MKNCFVIGIALMTMVSTLLGNPVLIQQQDTNEELITVSFAGDCTLGSYKGSNHKFDTIASQNDPAYFMSNVKPVFDVDDVTLVNLEGPLCDNPQEKVKTFSMKGLPEYTQILSEGSIEIVNLSNNHIYDCGQIGFEQTLENLTNAGIQFAGEDRITGYSKDGITVYFVGYNAFADTPELRSKIKEDIQVLKDVYEGDIVCVSFHWGEEYSYYPSSYQKSLAHFAIDNGADTVVGHHPHVVQGIENYNGKIIAYSLGNFCFGGNGNPKDKRSMILQVTYDKNGNIYNTVVVPCYITSDLSTNNFQPTVATGDAGVKIISDLIQYSSKFDSTIDFNTGDWLIESE